MNSPARKFHYHCPSVYGSTSFLVKYFLVEQGDQMIFEIIPWGGEVYDKAPVLYVIISIH